MADNNEQDQSQFGLIDFIILHQLMVEAYKLWLRVKFEPVQQEIAGIVRDQLSRLTVERLSELPKKDLKALTTRIMNLQQTPYHLWTRFLQTEMRNFSNVDQRAIHRGFKAILGASGQSMPTRGTAFKKADNLPLSSGGKLPDDFLNRFIAQSKIGIVDRINQGYASGETPQEVMRAIIGTRQVKFNDGLLARQHKNSNTVVNTLIQHLTGVASQLIEKTYTDCYIWLSIIDESTSDICFDLNRQVFRQGEGPIPPAHPNCRSGTAPWQCNLKPIENRAGVPQATQRSVKQWINAQDDVTLKDVFGRVRIELLENNQVTFSDLANTNLKPADVLRTAERLDAYLKRTYGT